MSVCVCFFKKSFLKDAVDFVLDIFDNFVHHACKKKGAKQTLATWGSGSARSLHAQRSSGVCVTAAALRLTFFDLLLPSISQL
jgi:hypothetical protein